MIKKAHNSLGLASIMTLCLLFMSTVVTGAPHEDCTTCHERSAPDSGNADLLLPVAKLCVDCHQKRLDAGEHATGIEPGPQGAADLPLEDGLIGCTTCHDPHSNTKSQLRVSADRLCLVCHDK